MANSVFDIDPELLSGFIDDSLDDLASLDHLFVALESSPDNLETINAIFRPVHSIKGNSAFFGLMKLKKLAHELETLLDLARKEKLVTDQAVISILLEGMDELKAILSRTSNQEPEIADEEKFSSLVERVIASKDSDAGVGVLESNLLRKLEELRKKCTELEQVHAAELDTIITMTIQLAADDNNAASGIIDDPCVAAPEALTKIISIVSQPCQENVSDEDSKIVLTCLTELQDTTENTEALAILDEAIDEYHTMVDTVGFDPLLCELLHDKMKKLSSLRPWGNTSDAGREVTSASGTSAESKPTDEERCDNEKTNDKENTNDKDGVNGNARQATKPAKVGDKTMRVSEDSIENFLGFVGELIVVGEMYNYLQRKAVTNGDNDRLAAEFKRINETFYNLSNSLQESIMEIRKVPIRILLQKAPRIVRDIAAASGKKIKVELVGEDIRIDKRLIETLDAPLTHMVRNSADHGVESPEARQAGGKDKQGVVRIVVSENEDDVTLAISDDGKGLDYDAIKNKAVKLGIVSPGEELTQEQVTTLLFTSGVSTATEVTDVSGRGVGMDVVKRNIVDANGEITVNSTAGKGTEFVIRLPKAVTTQIIDGYLVELGSNRYVIPLGNVREVFCAEPNDISSVTGQGECVLRHDKLLPVIRIFGCSVPADSENGGQTMVTIEVNDKHVALYVNNVIGIQRVVLKELDGLELESDVYSAAAVMGDGSLAMVLDIERLNEAIYSHNIT